MTNLDASEFVGRLAMCRVRHGEIRRGQQVAWCRADGSVEAIVEDLVTGYASGRNAMPEDWAAAGQSLDIAVEGLRKAGTLHHIPKGLLARAGYLRVRGEFDKAREDLQETLEICLVGYSTAGLGHLPGR